MTQPMLSSTAGEDFEALALPHLDALRRFASSLTRDAADADDLVQETFLRALRGWGTFQPDTNPRAWLFTICRNTFLRTRSRHRRVLAIEDGDAEVTSSITAQVRDTHAERANQYDQLDVQPAVRSAVGELREPYRSVLVLVDIEDRSYEEAAAILGVTTGTVKMRVHRARRLAQVPLLVHAIDAGLGNRRAVPLRSAGPPPQRRHRCA